MSWLTPDKPAQPSTAITITVPANTLFVGAVFGALLELCYSENWQEYGDYTPQEAAEIMSAAFQGITRI